MQKSDRNSAIAAAIILLVAGFGFFVMPTVMMRLADTSAWLAYAVAIIFVGAFFAVFWLRGRYQRRRGEGRSDR